MKLNKKEFIDKIAKLSGCPSTHAQKVLVCFQSVLLEVLKSEKEVNLLDIGKLKVSHRAAKTGINPKTKEPLKIAAKDVARLAPSKKMKSFIAGTDSVTIKDFTY